MNLVAKAIIKHDKSDSLIFLNHREAALKNQTKENTLSFRQRPESKSVCSVQNV